MGKRKKYRIKKKPRKKYRKVASYIRRNEVIKELFGFNSYEEYLQSELWAIIRGRVYGLHGKDCKLCGNRSQCLHHISYDVRTLRGRKLTKIVPLCYQCHNTIELYEDGTKKELQAAQYTYKILLKEAEKRLEVGTVPHPTCRTLRLCERCGAIMQKVKRKKGLGKRPFIPCPCPVPSTLQSLIERYNRSKMK